ncbi:MAG: type VI secretion system tip protein VgrG, partial [Pseudomonadota bacterium]|nr:type VI secretion system tip protein VgrG [Pseudomonadota bacterium]
AMTVGRKNACYVDMTDSDIITSLAGNCSGLSATVDATTITYPELVQYHCSDWDFLLARAEANGMVVISDGNTLTVQAPNVSAASALVVTYGIDMMDFHAELDARAQYATVKTASWDPASQQITEQQATPQAFTAQGNIESGTLAQVLALNEFRLQSNAALPSSALTAWAKAQQLKAQMARIRGHVSFQGSALAKIGGVMDLAGVGDRFNGTVYVSGVTHTFSDGNWVTRVDFGLAPTWFTERHELAARPASGLTAGISGLQIGVVKKLDADPEGHHKVQVSVPLMEGGDKGVWARLAKFYASSSFGAFFLPEIGDEVILGFINDDPSNPVILGSLYSSSRNPPYTLAAENNTKAIVTRSKLKLIFDEEKKKITLITPANNKIVIDDDGKSILIEDQTKNKVELNTGGITLDSPKDIKINAKGKVTIDAGMNVEITAKADIKEGATNITHTAKVGFTAKGSATAELSAGGNTTVKGAMVMIN